MATQGNKTSRRSYKALLFALHGWFTIPIWGLLLLICITGTLCTVSQELTWLVSPEVRAANPNNAASLSFDRLAETVETAYPGAKIRSIQLSASYLASLVRISLPSGDHVRVYVNQYTSQVQGEATGVGFRGFILALHGWLLFPWQDDYSIGWYLVTAVSIPLLGALITGLLLVKRFWRVFYQPRLRLRKGARVFWGDMHRLIGVWSMWFILTISASGLWFLIQGVLDQRGVAIYPPVPELDRDAVPITATGKAPAPVSIDDVVVRAQVVFPDLQVKHIELPENAYEVLTVRGTRGMSPLRENANAVHINPYSGDIVASRSAGDLSAVHFASALMVPLHFGDFGGLVSKLIWFFFGCLLSLMICSGLIIWTKRTAGATQKAQRKAAHATEAGLAGTAGKQRQPYAQWEAVK